MNFWGENKKQKDSSLIAMKVLNSFSLLPAVTVRTVCFDNSQKVYEFEELINELFSKAGTKIYGFDKAENAQASIAKALKTNPSLSKGTAYMGRPVSNIDKEEYSIKELNKVAGQLKSENLLPKEVVVLPIHGADIETKRFWVEETFKLIHVLGNVDWQQGLPSIIVAITDADHAFSGRLKAQKMAQTHALFFGY